LSPPRFNRRQIRSTFRTVSTKGLVPSERPTPIGEQLGGHCRRRAWWIAKTAIANTKNTPRVFEYAIWLDELGRPEDFPNARALLRKQVRRTPKNTARSKHGRFRVAHSPNWGDHFLVAPSCGTNVCVASWRRRFSAGCGKQQPPTSGVPKQRHKTSFDYSDVRLWPVGQSAPCGWCRSTGQEKYCRKKANRGRITVGIRPNRPG
jgi:hypothetical protein